MCVNFSLLKRLAPHRPLPHAGEVLYFYQILGADVTRSDWSLAANGCTSVLLSKRDDSRRSDRNVQRWRDWDPLLFPLTTSRGRLPSSAEPLASCPGCSGNRLSLDTVPQCVCVCVSLMAAFQVVRPNELIANGNWGLKCNWISRFLASVKGRRGGRGTGGWARRHRGILLGIIFKHRANRIFFFKKERGH